MNKYLMMFAAALIPAAASAGEATIGLTGSACSYWDLRWHGSLYSAHIVNLCNKSRSS